MALEFPSRVSVFEVGPRDGLQNESVILPVASRVRLALQLLEAGFSDIEVGSFVSPRWIPQLVDTALVLKALPLRPGVRFWVLVPNRRGLTDALAAGARAVAVFMSVTESHNQSNVNRSVSASRDELTQLIKEARREGVVVRAYLSTVFGCPYEGTVPIERVEALVSPLLEAGAWQISLGDTIGVAHPTQVVSVVSRLSRLAPLERFALHFHDTRGMALANVMAGLTMGITTFDSSIGGVGGCPYAPGASGNLATEDLLSLLSGAGVQTGISLEAAAKCGLLLRELLQHELPGRYHRYFLGQQSR